MAGFIILQDGRAFAGNNWGYDRVVEAIAESLPGTPEGRRLANWLLDQRNEVLGSGMGAIDVRSLTPQNQSLVIAAIRDAFDRRRDCPPTGEGWDAIFYKSWISRFADLVRMIESIERGEPPEAFNPHMKDILPGIEGKEGPGW